MPSANDATERLLLASISVARDASSNDDLQYRVNTMSTVKISPAVPEQVTLAAEMAQLREFDANTLRARWRMVFRKNAPPHLPRHLLMRVLAYRLQAECLGDLDAESQRLLDTSTSPEQVSARVTEARQRQIRLRPGTVLAREWKGQMQRVSVMADGFAWNGTTYSSLSRIARVITGTSWNGPKFFGLREKVRKDKLNDIRYPEARSLRHLHPRVG
jgi:hypothetical protein